MIARTFLAVLLVLGLTGCATTKKTSSLDELQIRVGQLEKRIEEKDTEISDLKNELSRASSETKRSRISADTQSADSSSGSKEGKIRVSASADQIQQALKSAGYYNGPVDGKLGRKTDEAIVSFQKDHNLKADGIIGRKTWAELKTHLE